MPNSELGTAEQSYLLTTCFIKLVLEVMKLCILIKGGVCVCVCACAHIMPYVNCFGRTVFYVYIELRLHSVV